MTRLSAALVLLCSLLAASVHRSEAFQSDHVVVMTIDGMRQDWADTMLVDLSSYMTANGAAYLPNFTTTSPTAPGTSSVTDPRHAAILTGYFEPINADCRNEGSIVHPTIFELLRKDRGVSQEQTVLVTGKQHLAETDAYSIDPGYGSTYGAYVVCFSGPYPEGFCPPDTVFTNPDEVPNEWIRDAAISHIRTYAPVFTLINFSFSDWRAHRLTTIYCNDTTAYFLNTTHPIGLKEIGRIVSQCVIDVIAACEAQPEMAGRTLFFVGPDHGRHNADVEDERVTRPKGWAHHLHKCLPVCSGCDDIFLWALSPGNSDVVPGTYLARHSHEGLGTTIRGVFGFPTTGDEPPISEIFSATDVERFEGTTWGEIKGLFE